MDKNMTNTWVCSDLHFNHRNILKYCPHRGGPETNDELVHAMNEKIISNWNEIVSPNDEVYCLGDVAMGRIELAPSLIRRLNGKKYLVRGNHDKTLTKPRDGYARCLADDLFEWVKDYHELSYVYEGKKHMICMSHYPMQSFNGMNQGNLHMHGHLHGSPSGLTGRIKDVGIDTNNLYPYLMDQVVSDLLKIDIVRDHHDNKD